MRGWLSTPEKKFPPCISPNVPEALKHHMHCLRIQRWIFLHWYWRSRPDHPNNIIDWEIASIHATEALDRKDLERAVRESWHNAVRAFISTNRSITSATEVRMFSKTLRAYDDALYDYARAEPKEHKHLQAIFKARFAYEASARTVPHAALPIATLAGTHFTTQDTVSRAPGNQAAWQSFQATARVKEEGKHGFKIGFWMGVGLVAMVAVTVAAIVFSGGLASIPVLAGAVAAHSATTVGVVAAGACAVPPVAIGSLFGSLGALVQRLVEWGSPQKAPVKPAPPVVVVPVRRDSSLGRDLVEALQRSGAAAAERPGGAAGSPAGLRPTGGSGGSLPEVTPPDAGVYTIARPMAPPPHAVAGASPQA